MNETTRLEIKSPLEIEILLELVRSRLLIHSTNSEEQQVLEDLRERIQLKRDWWMNNGSRS